MLGKAQSLLLDDAFRVELGEHLARSRAEVLNEWYKSAKNDVVLRLRHGSSREALEAAFLPTDEFQARWTAKTRQLMAKFEWSKRQMAARIKDEEKRVTKGEQEAQAEHRAKQKQHKDWDKDDRREERVGGWRSFAEAQQGKKRKATCVVCSCFGSYSHGVCTGLRAQSQRSAKGPARMEGPKLIESSDQTSSLECSREDSQSTRLFVCET